MKRKKEIFGDWSAAVVLCVLSRNPRGGQSSRENHPAKLVLFEMVVQMTTSVVSSAKKINVLYKSTLEHILF